MPNPLQIARLAWRTVGKPLIRGRWKFLSEPGKRGARLLEQSVALRATNYGRGTQKMVDAGFISNRGKILLNEKQWRQLALAVEQGDHHATKELLPYVKSYRAITKDAINKTRAVDGHVQSNEWVIKDVNESVSADLFAWFGEGRIITKKITSKPVGEIDKYMPHFLKKEYAEAFFDDGNRIFKHAAGITENWNYFNPQKRRWEAADIAQIGRLVDNAMGGGTLNKKTQDALTLLISRGYKPGEAMVMLRDRAASQITNPFGSLKKARKMNLMSEAYEENPIVALDTYLRLHAKHVAELEVWGPKYEIWKETLFELSAKAPKEVRDFEMLSGIVQGTAEFKYTSRAFRKFTKGITEFEVGTKIGLGTAWIPNILQHLISTIPKVGVWRFSRGALQAFTKEGRAKARQAGFFGRRNLALEIMAGLPEEYTKSGRLSRIMTGHPGMWIFNWINKQNNIVSALAGESYLKSLHKIANTSKLAVRKKWAISHLEKYGIDPAKKLDDITLQNGMWRFATDMQLQRNAMADPIWMNDPRFRFLALFKRFGYRQSMQMYDNVLMDLPKGNVLPLLRLAAGGTAGGWAVTWAKDAIRRGIFKHPESWVDTDKGMFQQFLFWHAQNGSMGWISDLVGRTKGVAIDEITESYIDNLYYFITPVVASELFGILGSKYDKGWAGLTREFIVDWSKEGAGYAVGRQAPAAMRRVSPLASYLVSAQKAKQRLAQARSKAIRKAFGGL